MTNEEAREQIKIIKAFMGYDKDNPIVKKAQEALDMAIKALEQTRWIPVSERLPKQQQIVLIQDFGQTTIGYLNAENRWRDLTNLDDYLKGVEAWMPLPEPYKEDDNANDK